MQAALRLASRGGLDDLLGGLLEAGWVREGEDDAAPAEARGEGLWFVGHNAVLACSKKARVLVDPWLRPWRDADPDDYKPIRACDVGPVDAIVITHSHGDHFHLGSLLSFPRETLMLVPHVERESILATDMARRLREIGFTHVRTMRWWESTTVGDIEVAAMPFHGEQACVLDLVDPALRNVGNTWRVRAPSFSAAFLADTGRDPAGSMLDVALAARRLWGPTDFVFSGIRGFTLAPLMLPFTTLDAMFVNVPIDLLAVPMPLMHDADGLATLAQVFGARAAVPYADGGAPWYWREGMGPTYAGYPEYPGEIEAAMADAEIPRSAPFPERLVEAVRVRSDVEPLVLRPGDLVRIKRERIAVGRVEGFAWPYAEAPAGFV
jgi:L-ascorbate metabolism protein UlaG (beta-lactamase superfamily)